MSVSFYSFLQGKWSVKRNVFDSNKQPQALFIGELNCKPNGKDSLAFEEELEGLFDNHCGKSWLKQELTFNSPTNASLFQKGEYFHHLEFDTPFTLVHHACKEDQYLGLYVFHKENKSFTMTWKIKGPKKNYSLRAYYKKVD
jgi:hypothetical protein